MKWDFFEQNKTAQRQESGVGKAERLLKVFSSRITRNQVNTFFSKNIRKVRVCIPKFSHENRKNFQKEIATSLYFKELFDG